jgi:hypothetical protein
MTTSSLPRELLEVLERSSACTLVTIDEAGRPRARDTRASLHGPDCLDVSAQGAGDPHVAVLVAADAGCVLVQGTAQDAGGGTLHIRPERIYAWPPDDPEAEPTLWDAHLEEVRSAHNAEPEEGPPPGDGRADLWDERLDGIGGLATLGFMGPDRFPFAVRLPVRPDPDAGVLRLDGDPVGAPIEVGAACLSAAGLEVRGDLVAESGRWVLHPHAVG